MVHSTLVESPPPSRMAVKLPSTLPWTKVQVMRRGFSLTEKWISVRLPSGAVSTTRMPSSLISADLTSLRQLPRVGLVRYSQTRVGSQEKEAV